MVLALGWKTDPYKVASTDIVLAFNDASLVWGGLFDITCPAPTACSWQSPHREHKRGIVIDVRANGGVDAIAPADFREFEKIARISGMTFLHESGGTPNEHYHVRLLGSKG